MGTRVLTRGFTLIELLVVIAIIGLLSSVVLASLNTARLKARTAKSLTELAQIHTALEAYYAQYGSYPVSNGYQGYCSRYGASLGDNWIPELTAAGLFSGRLPTDPRQPGGGAPCISGDLQYIYYSNGSDFKLIAHLAESMNVPASRLDPARPTYCWGYWSAGGAGL